MSAPMISEGLKELRSNPAIKGSAVISKDGVIIGSDLPPGVYVDTFAIMSATVLGAAVTANSELKLQPPKMIHIVSDDDTIVIVNAGRKVLVVLIVSKGTDIEKTVGEVSPVLSKLSA